MYYPFYVMYPHDNYNPADDIYVNVDFLSAGRHHYFVYMRRADQSEEVYFNSFVAPPRREDIQVSEKEKKMKMGKRFFDKNKSVFREWREDTTHTLKKSLEIDLRYWKAPRFIKDAADLGNVVHLIEENVYMLKSVFMAVVSASTYPFISWIDFSNLATQLNIVDKNVSFATIDRLFIATNAQITRIPEIPERELTRFEFYEILLRAAGAKFVVPGICQTYAEAFRKLLEVSIRAVP